MNRLPDSKESIPSHEHEEKRNHTAQGKHNGTSPWRPDMAPERRNADASNGIPGRAHPARVTVSGAWIVGTDLPVRARTTIGFPRNPPRSGNES